MSGEPDIHYSRRTLTFYAKLGRFIPLLLPWLRLVWGIALVVCVCVFVYSLIVGLSIETTFYLLAASAGLLLSVIGVLGTVGFTASHSYRAITVTSDGLTLLCWPVPGKRTRRRCVRWDEITKAMFVRDADGDRPCRMVMLHTRHGPLNLVDAVYRPSETTTLTDAIEEGCKGHGVDMAVTDEIPPSIESIQVDREKA